MPPFTKAILGIEPGMHLSSIKITEIELAAIKRADRLVLHTHDDKPIHVTTAGLDVAEKAKDVRIFVLCTLNSLKDKADAFNGTVRYLSQMTGGMEQLNNNSASLMLGVTKLTTKAATATSPAHSGAISRMSAG